MTCTISNNPVSDIIRPTYRFARMCSHDRHHPLGDHQGRDVRRGQYALIPQVNVDVADYEPLRRQLVAPLPFIRRTRTAVSFDTLAFVGSIVSSPSSRLLQGMA